MASALVGSLRFVLAVDDVADTGLGWVNVVGAVPEEKSASRLWLAQPNSGVSPLLGRQGADGGR